MSSDDPPGRRIYGTPEGTVQVFRVGNRNSIQVTGTNVHKYSDGSMVLQTTNGTVFVGKDDNGFTMIKTPVEIVTITPNGECKTSRLQAHQQGEFTDINPPKPEMNVTQFFTQDEKDLWHSFFSTYSRGFNDYFYETKNYIKARKMLWDRNHITLTGHPGEGKSTIAEGLMIHFTMSGTDFPQYEKTHLKEFYLRDSILDAEREAYNHVVCKSAEEWKRKVDYTKRQIILLDDIFGPGSLDLKKVNEWLPILKKLETTLRKQDGKTLLIICLSKSQYERLPADMHLMSFFKKYMIMDLSLRTNHLDYHEKEMVLQKNGLYGASNVQHMFHQTHKTFPYSCMLYGRVKSFQMESKKFFDNPERAIDTVIGKVHSFNKTIYFTLTLCVMFDGKLDLNKYTVEEFTEKQQEIIRVFQTAVHAPDTDLDKLRYAAVKLNGNFFAPTGRHAWKFAHERLMHAVANHVHSNYGKLMIEHCSEVFFFTRLQGGYAFRDSFDSRIGISTLDHQTAFQRLTFESLSGNIERVVAFPGLEDERFASEWFAFMSDMGSLLMVVQQRAAFNRSMFFWAAFYGYSSTVKIYLEHEDLAEIREEEWFKDEKNAAILAACCGRTRSHAKTVSILLDAGAPLYPIECLSEEDVEELYGGEVAMMLKLKAPLMQFVALRGDGTAIKTLAEKGCKLDETSLDGYTPAHRAAVNRNVDAMRQLITLKAPINNEGHNGRRPFHLASMSGNKEVIEELLRKDVAANDAPMHDGSSSLIPALLMGDDYYMKDLVEKGFGVNGKSISDLMNPLHMAVCLRSNEMVDALLDKKADINQKSGGGMSPLHLAVYTYNKEIVKRLLEKNADVNATTISGKSALAIAAESGFHDICEMLLEAKAKPEVTNSRGDYPIVLAAKNGHINIVRLLATEGLELTREQTMVDDLFW